MPPEVPVREVPANRDERTVRRTVMRARSAAGSLVHGTPTCDSAAVQQRAAPPAHGRPRSPARRSRRLALALCAGAAWACGAAPAPASAPRPRSVALRHLEVPTVEAERAALAAIPSVRADRVALAVAFPEGFDPARPHPILITQVTADRYRPNVDELGAYAPSALREGYVVLTAQSIPWPSREGSDTLMLRYATVRAALRWLAREVPASRAWPIVFAGFSGGAKIAQVLAFSAMLEEHPVAGVFLGGCNEDHSRVLLAEHPSLRARFAQVAYYVSAGDVDGIAPPLSARGVAEGLRRSGARHVELSVHGGGHRLDVGDLERALRWFRTRIDERGARVVRPP